MQPLQDSDRKETTQIGLLDRFRKSWFPPGAVVGAFAAFVAAALRVELHAGDATRPETLTSALSGCEAVINLIGIIRENPGQEVTFQRLHVEATRHLISAAQAAGIKRFHTSHIKRS